MWFKVISLIIVLSVARANDERKEKLIFVIRALEKLIIGCEQVSVVL